MTERVTKYQRAMIRLEAFRLLKGWGVTRTLADGTKEHAPYDLEQHKSAADRVAKWALSDDYRVDES